MPQPKILIGAESLAPGNGGICRVARLMARVIGERVQAGEMDARCAVLSDAEQPSDIALPTVVASGSRLRFAAQVHQAAFSHTHFIYDFVGVARAHARLPILRRPFMT